MGDYSVSREQFDAANFVSRKIFQHGTRVVDADQNEQVLIDLHRQRRISYGLMGRIDQRIGVSFAFQSGGSNQVSLHKGDAFVEMTDDGIGGTHHIYKDNDTTITGFTTPSGAGRTDYVYLDIYFEIIDSDDDTGLINPDVAAESAVDIRAKMDWLKIEGASIPSAPAGHTYVGLLQIDRLDGNANITEAMCTNLLEKFDDWLEEDGTVSLKGNMAVDAGVTIDDRDISKITRSIYAQNKLAAFTEDATCPDWADTDAWYRTGKDLTPEASTIIRTGFRLRQGEQYILFSGEAKGGTNGDLIRFGVGPWNNPDYYSQIEVVATSWGTYYTGYYQIPASYNVGDWVPCGAALFNIVAGASNVYLRKVTLDVAQEIP